MTLPLSPAPPGTSLNLPSTTAHVDGCVRFDLPWALGVPVAAGVYFIHDLRGVLYVGRTASLRKRFGEHHSHSHNPKLRHYLGQPVGLVFFSWVEIAEPHQGHLERELIEYLRPACNIQHNRGGGPWKRQ